MDQHSVFGYQWKAAVKKCKILIVDGEKDWRKFSKRALEQAGYGVTVVKALREAGPHAEKERPCLVVVDDLELGSPDATMHLKQLGDAFDLVVISSSPTMQSVRTAFRSGRILDFRNKPYEESQLVSLVADELEETQH